MRCPTCERENQPGGDVCAGCGRTLHPSACPACGFRNPGGFRHCGDCGARFSVLPGSGNGPGPGDGLGNGLAQPVDADAALEQRQATVIFCDLVGSTHLSEQLDPERYRDLIVHEYQPICRSTIEHYGGTIARFEGDGILARFGYPRAMEDAAHKAVAAGLELVEAAGGMRGGVDGAPLAIRVGVATGVVIAGRAPYAVAAGDEPVVGEAPNRSKRMQELAQPNEVVIGDETHRLVRGGFDCARVGDGHAEARAWRVLRQQRAVTRFSATRGARMHPLVGRVEAYGRLRTGWTAATGANGRVALVTGEPGIGKSHLVQSFVDGLDSTSFRSVAMQCSDLHQRTPLYPIISQLEYVARFSRHDSARVRREKLRALCVGLGIEVSGELVVLETLLKIRETGDGELTRSRIFSSVINVLERLCAERTLLVVVEDAHWIDPTSAELLDAMVRRLVDLPLMLVVTTRTPDRCAWHEQPHVTRIALDGLSSDDQASLAQLEAGSKALPPEVLASIVERSNGVPLAVEELTRMLVDSDLLSEEADRYTLRERVTATEVPMGLKDSLLARLDSLSTGRTAIRFACVLGQRFPAHLIEKLWGEADQSADRLDHELGAACAAGVLSRVGEESEPEYAFRHALVRDAAYENLLQRDRADLHRRAAAVMARLDARQTNLAPELIAHHFARGSRPGLAAVHWNAAARQAVERSAHEEAIAHVHSALEALPRADGIDASALELELRTSLGVALIAAHGWAADAVRENYERALALCDDAAGVMARFRTERGLLNFFLIRGEIGDAKAKAAELASIAAANGDPGLVADANRSWGGCHLHAGEYAEARRCLDAGLAGAGEAQPAKPTSVYGADPQIVVLGLGAWTDWYLGDIAGAERKLDAALRRATVVDHPFSESYAYALASAVHQSRRNPEQSERYANLSLEVADAHDLEFWHARGLMIAGWATALRTDRESGLAKLREGIDAYETTGARQLIPYGRLMEAEINLDLGRFEEAERCADQALETATRLGLVMHIGEAHRLRGTALARLDGGLERAVADLRLASRHAHETGAPVLALRADVSMLALCPRSPERNEAARRVAAGLDALGAHPDEPDTIAARDVLENAATRD